MRANIQLYNSDCLPAMRKMADNQYGLAIVDLPFGIGLDFLLISDNNPTKHEIKKWNDMVPGSEYFEQLYRISKNQIIWGCNYFGANIKDVGRIVFYKNPTSSRLSYCDLASCSLQKRITYFEYQWAGNVQGGKINWKNINHGFMEKRIHPTQKPVKLYKWLLKNYAKEGDKILDTHGGSMSSVIASIDMGFDITCYEIDADYYNEAKKRILNYVSQLRIYNKQPILNFNK